MKKNWMKVVVVALSCMMAVAMTGCGGGSSSSGDGDVLKLGCIGPVTGPAAVYGKAVENGAKIAVDEINASDPAFKLEFTMQDDEHDAEKSVNAFNKLMDDGMQVLVGTVTTAPCQAVAAEAYAARVFALTPSASGTAVVEGNDNVYQLCFQDPQQGVIVADRIAEESPDAKVGVIYNNSDNYSTGIFDSFKKELSAKGMKVVAEATFSDDANPDFNAQLTKMKVAGVDLLFVPIYYTPASNIMKQAESMGYDVNFFGVDGMDGILTIEGFDITLAEGVKFLTPFSADSQDEKTQAFVKAYEEAYGEKPIQFAADAYDCVYAIYDAFQKTGCAVTDDAATICEKMIELFNGGYTYEGGLTGDKMSWSESGAVDKTPRIFEIVDGKYVER